MHFDICQFYIDYEQFALFKKQVTKYDLGIGLDLSLLSSSPLI